MVVPFSFDVMPRTERSVRDGPWEVFVVFWMCDSIVGACDSVRFSAGGLAFSSKEGNFGLKIVESVKGAIDRSEAKVGDFIKFAEGCQNSESHLLGRDFTISCGAEKIFDALCK
jgi:hypothetical protein